MSPTLIAQLLVQFGLPLTQQLFSLHASGKTEVTQEDFDALIKLSNYSSADSLAAAGLKLENGRVVPLA